MGIPTVEPLRQRFNQSKSFVFFVKLCWRVGSLNKEMTIV
jgi:hypothetical protein